MEKRKIKIITIMILTAFSAVSFGSSVFAEDFYIGGFWAPPAEYTNDTQYDNVRDANIGYMLNQLGSSVDTVAENIALLDECDERGLKGIVTDARTYWLDSLTESEIDTIADDYINHPGLGGYYVIDEPKPPRWQGYSKAYNRFLYKKPGSIPYINLQPYYADAFTNLEIAPTEAVTQLVRGNGDFAKPNVILGQTFQTPSDCSFIYGIELNVDSSQWAATEGLILRLWNSTSKTNLISERTLFGTNNVSYPRFELDAIVSPNTTYYMELLHSGGGDNSIGWVCRSTTNSYNNGVAYVNGIAKSYDYYFKVYGSRTKAPIDSIVQMSADSSRNVSSSNCLGQSIRTASDQNYIKDIELKLNYATWSTTEGLTLTLWDSSAKNTQIASSTLYSTNNMYNPKFPINAAVSPSTNYYFELTHNGGGDNLVSSVSCTTGVIDRYPNGRAYVQGMAQNFDLYFKLYKQDRILKPLLTSQTLQGTGYNISSSNPLGQTFKTPAGCSNINTIQLKIDYSTWGTGESLTLKLWDSPSKTTQIGAAYTLTATNNFSNPEFTISANVSANTTYYWELTHNGGGDNSIGWVWNSNSNNYSNGSAYQNGSVLSNDFVFRVYANSEVKDKVTEQKVNTNGDYVSSGKSFGQTFRTPVNLERMLQYIELNIDSSTWSTDEVLTLTIYDSTSKNRKLGQASMSASNNRYYPRFYVNSLLNPNTTYYFELTHNGGGNNSVGWVCRSASNVYADGSGYLNGAAQSWDLRFKCLYRAEYQDYLTEFIDIMGPQSLHFLSFDNYPFTDNTIRKDYYINLELIRDMGLKTGIKTHSYLQSIGMPAGSSGMNRPNANQMRWNVYTTLAYGVKGITWFTYWPPDTTSTTFSSAIMNADGTKSELYIPAQTYNMEMKVLGPTLMGLMSQEVYYSGPIEMGTKTVPNDFFWKPASTSDNVIVSYFKNASNRKYIMVVNKSTNETLTKSFNINPKPTTVTEVSKTTGQEVSTNYNSTTGVISATFAPGEGRLYALPSGY